MSSETRDLGPSRRAALRCMMYGGAGVLWTVVGGVPRPLNLGGAALAAEPGFSFAQISDTHIGFKGVANPDPGATLKDGIARVLGAKPTFVVHTGDVSHLSKPEQFDTAKELMKGSGLDTFYVPGEHDTIEDDGKAFFERFGRAKGTGGWYSFDAGGVHFVALVNVVGLKAGGMGTLGAAQREWMEDDLKAVSASTPVVVLAHMPLWSVYADWGWGTDDAEPAIAYLRRFGSVTVLNGHIHQVVQKVEGNITFHTADATAFPQAAPGAPGASPGPLKIPADQARKLLGVRNVEIVKGGPAVLADQTLGA